MSKLLSALLLGVFAFAMNAPAIAADQQSGGNQARDNQTQQQNQAQGTDDPAQHNQTPNQAQQAGAEDGNMGRNPNQPGGEVTAKEKEYLADIKKCDSMAGDQKNQCVNAAKKKAGQM